MECEEGAMDMTATWCGGIVTAMIVTSLVSNLLGAVYISVTQLVSLETYRGIAPLCQTDISLLP